MVKINGRESYLITALYDRPIDPRAPRTPEQIRQMNADIRKYFTETANTLVAIGKANVPGIRVVHSFTGVTGSITVVVSVSSARQLSRLRQKLGRNFVIGVNNRVYST